MIKFIKQSIYIIIFATVINVAFVSYAYAAISSDELVNLSNSSRTQNNLKTLTKNSKLEQAATAKAEDMFKNQYFAHNAPSGKTPWDFINASEYNYIYAGENLAIGYADNTELHNAWMNSPSHRDNILNPNYREVGIAEVSGTFEGSLTTIVVQEFGSTEINQPTNNTQSGTNANQSNLINMEQSKVTPEKIFAGDKIELKAVSTTALKEVYYKIGEQKIDMSNSLVKDSEFVYQKNVNINQVGLLPITLIVVDNSGNRESLSIGKLTVASKILAGSAYNPDNINNNNLIISIIAIIFIMIGITLFYIIYKRKIFNKQNIAKFI